MICVFIWQFLSIQSSAIALGFGPVKKSGKYIVLATSAQNISHLAPVSVHDTWNGETDGQTDGQTDGETDG